MILTERTWMKQTIPDSITTTSKHVRKKKNRKDEGGGNPKNTLTILQTPKSIILLYYTSFQPNT